MLNRRGIVVLGCALLTLLGAGLVLVMQSGAGAQAIDDKLIWGTPQNGLRSRIWVAKDKVAVNSPIVVHYAIQNVSNETKVVWHSGFWPNHRIDVTDSKGKAVPLTALGEQFRKAFDPGGKREKNVPLELAPGTVDAAWVEYNLLEFFAIRAPGRYVVQYLYEEKKGEGVKSNLLEIVVE